MSEIHPNKIYAQISSNEAQTPNTTEPTLVTFNSRDFINGIRHGDDKPSDIIVPEDGVYFMMAAGQMGRKSGALLRLCDLWLSVNGQDVPNTGVRSSAPASLFVGDTIVLVTQVVLPLKKDDVINVLLSVSAINEGLGLIYTEPKGQAAIPSIIITMYKI